MYLLKEREISDTGKSGSPKINLSSPKYLFLVMAALILVIYLVFRTNPGDQVHSFYQVMLDTSVELQISASSSADAELIRDDVFAVM